MAAIFGAAILSAVLAAGGTAALVTGPLAPQPSSPATGAPGAGHYALAYLVDGAFGHPWRPDGAVSPPRHFAAKRSDVHGLLDPSAASHEFAWLTNIGASAY